MYRATNICRSTANSIISRERVASFKSNLGGVEVNLNSNILSVQYNIIHRKKPAKYRMGMAEEYIRIMNELAIKVE